MQISSILCDPGVDRISKPGFCSARVLLNPSTLSTDGRLTLAQALPAQPTTCTLSVKVCDGMPLCDSAALVVDTGAGVSQVFRDGFED